MEKKMENDMESGFMGYTGIQAYKYTYIGSQSLQILPTLGYLDP